MKYGRMRLWKSEIVEYGRLRNEIIRCGRLGLWEWEYKVWRMGLWRNGIITYSRMVLWGNRIIRNGVWDNVIMKHREWNNMVWDYAGM